jgi:hypothetical protein
VLDLWRDEYGLSGLQLVLVKANTHRRLALDDVVKLVRSPVLPPVLLLANFQAYEVADYPRAVQESEARRPFA